MASPSVTYTFTNGTTADAAQVNQNFSDLIAAMTDGSKSFSIDALTVAGTATLNGNVNLGSNTSDVIDSKGPMTVVSNSSGSFEWGNSTSIGATAVEANFAVSGTTYWQWIRMGNLVIVTVQIAGNNTGSAGPKTFRSNPPIASALTNDYQVIGTVTNESGYGGICYANAGTDQVDFYIYMPAGVTACRAVYSYLILT